MLRKTVSSYSLMHITDLIPVSFFFRSRVSHSLKTSTTFSMPEMYPTSMVLMSKSRSLQR